MGENIINHHLPALHFSVIIFFQPLVLAWAIAETGCGLRRKPFGGKWL